MHERIRELLKVRGMTQQELAREIGTTEASMSRYCKGQRIPKATTVGKMAKVLNTTTDYIILGE